MASDDILCENTAYSHHHMAGSVDVEEKGFKISPRPCQGASVSNCSENGNANKIDGFSFFLFLFSASKALVFGGQG